MGQSSALPDARRVAKSEHQLPGGVQWARKLARPAQKLPPSRWTNTNALSSRRACINAPGRDVGLASSVAAFKPKTSNLGQTGRRFGLDAIPPRRSPGSSLRVERAAVVVVVIFVAVAVVIYR